MSMAAADADRLVVILEGRPLGHVERTANGLRLRYDAGYTDDPSSTPLSLALPKESATHGDRPVEAWLWGLLPDNADVLARWGRELGVSVASPFGLLSTQVRHNCRCRPVPHAGGCSGPSPHMGGSGPPGRRPDSPRDGAGLLHVGRYVCLVEEEGAEALGGVVG